MRWSREVPADRPEVRLLRRGRGPEGIRGQAGPSCLCKRLGRKNRMLSDVEPFGAVSPRLPP